ncbi:MAG: acyltransferase domain-containing protein [Deltaproteobacteria bacterium]|nr:MAG: acyltransferase domain-containing protein [Deltaproteobacteria bacterium]
MAARARHRRDRRRRQLLRPRRQLAAARAGPARDRPRARPRADDGRAVRAPDDPRARTLPRRRADRGPGCAAPGGTHGRTRAAVRPARPPRRGQDRRRGDRVTPGDTAIAVIGLACRLPGADTPEALWANLIAGRESIAFFDAAGAPVGAPVVADEGEVIRAAGLVDGAEQFDAALFGFSRLEATMLDPQHRLFLETAYAALDAAGCDPRRCPGLIGVYAGGSETPYLALLRAHRDQLAGATDWQLRLATGVDFLTSRAAYELGLRGPAVTVQTGCSTSLVAIHVAAQALLAGDCDVALAGGATINIPVQLGRYTEGGILSPDGRCRAFDARAQGTVGADGVVIAVLKRLADALADRDHVHAVLLGSAVNNDADGKIGFTAPGIEGQARAIRAAHDAAGIEPHTIGLIEAHGTGTALGDPIEVAALHRAFAGHPGPCWLGSIKTNLGHTDAAAGAAGFVKAVLALERRQIPPILHFTTANPQLGLERGPFAINAAPCAWPDGPTPRRAGVSSFGIGGTNAHAVLEEAPPRPASPASGPQLVVLSAASRASLDRMAAQLAAHLYAAVERGAPPDLGDVAWTLQVGRQQHALRRFAVCDRVVDAIAALSGPLPPAIARDGAPRLVLMFPGQGGQRVGMARALYRTHHAFRDVVDRCAHLAEPALALDLRAVLYPDAAGATEAAERLADMDVAQVAVFAIEVALAELWRAWGVTPDAVVGHSLGAFAAATVAGVMSLEDALALVLARSRLLARLPPGAMLAVALPEAALAGRLGPALSIAAVNAASQCTALRRELAAGGVEARTLHIPRPAHSPALEPMLDEFEAAVRAIELRPPRLPWASDMTGDWISPRDATDPRYYAHHLRRTVRFADALSTVLDGERAAVIEAGPGRTLTQLARQHPRAAAHVILATLPHPADPTPDDRTALEAVGRLWAAGAAIDWPAIHDGPRSKVPLPTYAFDRQTYALARPDGVLQEPETIPASGRTNGRIAGTTGPMTGQTIDRTTSRIMGPAAGNASDPIDRATSRMIGPAAGNASDPIDRANGPATGRVIESVAQERDAAGNPVLVPRSGETGGGAASDPIDRANGRVIGSIAHERDAAGNPVHAPGSAATASPCAPDPDHSIALDGAVLLRVAEIFGEVLGLAEVAAHDDFFERGGDSLMAAQLATRLRAAFPGVAVRPRTVFQARTVAGLASWIAGETAHVDPTGEAPRSAGAAVEVPTPHARRSPGAQREPS